MAVGILVLLEAKEGKGEELGGFLEAGLELAIAEQGTVRWHAFKVDDTNYGIFDTFESEAGRQEHLNGEIAAKLGEIAGEMQASAPDIRQIDILAEK